MAINKVIYGNDTLIDLTGDTVTSSTLLMGGIAHNAAGEQVQGSFKIKVSVPVASDAIYDGTQKTVVLSPYDTDTIQVSGTTTATKVGEYTITLSLKNTDAYVWIDGTTADKTVTWKIIAKIVTWSNGTDSELVGMLDAHYNGTINIYDYWSVGDERTVHLDAMSATGVGESHAAQDVTLVLMNKGGKTLYTAINGHTTCAFIVGQKNSLATTGYMNDTNVNAGGWHSCKRRTWCNSVYRNAIPSTLRGIFKRHKNKTSKGSTGPSVVTESTDYFALPSEKEVFGSVTYANSTAEANNTRFKYYETSANRVKKLGESGSAGGWWERSPYDGTGNTFFCSVDSSGTASSSFATYDRGLAPFGVI